jgi:hypothetical protein
VARRHCEIDSDPEWVAGMLRLVGVLNHNIATANVITKSIETGRFAANEFVELVGFLNTAIRDFDRQLHTPV